MAVTADVMLAAAPSTPLAEAIEEALQEGATYDPYGPGDTPEHLFEYKSLAHGIEGLDAFSRPKHKEFLRR